MIAAELVFGTTWGKGGLGWYFVQCELRRVGNAT